VRGYAGSLMLIAAGMRGYFLMRQRPPRNRVAALLLQVLALVFVAAGIVIAIMVATSGSARIVGR
jgi:hypothetical protein